MTADDRIISRFNSPSFKEVLGSWHQTRRTLHGLGLSVVDRGRFSNYSALLTAATDGQPHIHQRAPHEFVHGVAEISALGYVVEELVTRKLAKGVEQKLRKVLVGGVVPVELEDGDASRSTLFELLIAASLQRCGLEVRLDEPDVVVSDGVRQYGLAAKRLRSKKRVRQRTREAIRQLRSARLRGLIALDISEVSNPRYDIGFYSDSSTILDDLDHRVSVSTSRWARAIWAEDRAVNVCGCLMFASWPYASMSDQRFGTASSLMVTNTCLEDSGDFAFLHDLALRLQRDGLP
ncbi:MAG: hypothetical protein IPN34_14525 [Planctomycetes bacterium]|nr:hypothetical protein [Planctomycetota bacterium]